MFAYHILRASNRERSWCEADNRQVFQLDQSQNNPDYARSRFSRRLIPHLQGKIHLAEERPYAALKSFSRSLKQYWNVEPGLQQVALLATYGYADLALLHLADVRDVLRKQSEKRLKRSRAKYQQEIARLDRLLREELRNPVEPEPEQDGEDDDARSAFHQARS